MKRWWAFGTGLFRGQWEQDRVTYKPFPNQEAAIQAFSNGELDILIFIPSDYVETGAVVRIERGRIGLLQDLAPPGLDAFLRGNLLRGEVSSDVLERIQWPARGTLLQVDEEGQLSPPPVLDPGQLIFFGALMVMITFSVLTTSSYFLEGLSEEKENRVMEVLLSSLSPQELMLGKLVGLGTAGLIRLVLWVAFGAVLLGVAKETSLTLPSMLAELRFPLFGPAISGFLYCSWACYLGQWVA
ncbi:MAG: ABC transporter, permease protein [Acetothermia bacterium 64_32]|nr:MAG: ABC transporter, permease protein [Acetothermia bacterium 64_32]HAF70605.1 hypothetical protein [Candidatus Acetothermia bacterium]